MKIKRSSHFNLILCKLAFKGFREDWLSLLEQSHLAARHKSVNWSWALAKSYPSQIVIEGCCNKRALCKNCFFTLFKSKSKL